ncbi:MAG TPA: RNase adapter RapZ, partial [Prolixibacteraceae bacterium]|nr:RNase adapter RapZ [Prolixibacteraceae bacterium]
MDIEIKTLTSLFEFAFKTKPAIIEPLPRSGSDRSYFRIKADEQSVIGAFNLDIKENEAFFSFTQTFLQLGIHVPQILAIAPDRQHYLISDLGPETLFDRIQLNGKNSESKTTLCLIKELLPSLLKIQIEGATAIDFSKCYPRNAFDRQSVVWDLNYFKYEFLKLTALPFDEQALEDDFNKLADFLTEAPTDYFMYRDFQSRNIMMKDKEFWFIDYQGGRKGPLQYDLASLLYSPKTGLNDTQREVMLELYLNHLEDYTDFDREQFIDYYYGFVLIRVLQALGAYSFRGIIEGKPNFRSSIPTAIKNLKFLTDKNLIKVDLPEIFRIINDLSQSEWAKKYEPTNNQLTVRVTSFSYKKGIPLDPSENGGGFVFDCRGLPNPGRLKEYKQFTGCDQPVIDYLEQFDEVKEFQDEVRKIVGISIKNYLERGFSHLSVNFGCTGGQHRSVYHAEKFAHWVENNFTANVVLIHREQMD